MMEKLQIQHRDGDFFVYRGGRGPKVILLPGFGDAKKTFLRLSKHLNGQVDLILPDMPGFGDSAPMAPAEYALSKQVKRLQALVAALGLEQFHMGGNSAGGQVAALYALANPSQVQSLVLMAPQGMKSESFNPYSHKAQAPQSIADFEANLARLYHQPPTMPLELKQSLLAKSQGRWDFLNDIRKAIRAEPQAVLNDLAKQITCPLLLLWGEQDGRIPPDLAPYWLEALPQTELHWLPACGHLPQLEQAPLTAELMLEFLSRMPETQSAR